MMQILHDKRSEKVIHNEIDKILEGVLHVTMNLFHC
jgi:hypothetical protein